MTDTKRIGDAGAAAGVVPSTEAWQVTAGRGGVSSGLDDFKLAARSRILSPAARSPMPAIARPSVGPSIPPAVLDPSSERFACWLKTWMAYEYGNILTITNLIVREGSFVFGPLMESYGEKGLGERFKKGRESVGSFHGVIAHLQIKDVLEEYVALMFEPKVISVLNRFIEYKKAQLKSLSSDVLAQVEQGTWLDGARDTLRGLNPIGSVRLLNSYAFAIGYLGEPAKRLIDTNAGRVIERLFYFHELSSYIASVANELFAAAMRYRDNVKSPWEEKDPLMTAHAELVKRSFVRALLLLDAERPREASSLSDAISVESMPPPDKRELFDNVMRLARSEVTEEPLEEGPPEEVAAETGVVGADVATEVLAAGANATVKA